MFAVKGLESKKPILFFAQTVCSVCPSVLSICPFSDCMSYYCCLLSCSCFLFRGTWERAPFFIIFFSSLTFGFLLEAASPRNKYRKYWINFLRLSPWRSAIFIFWSLSKSFFAFCRMVPSRRKSSHRNLASYLCNYMHIYMCIYIYVYVYKHIYIYVHTYVSAIQNEFLQSVQKIRKHTFETLMI